MNIVAVTYDQPCKGDRPPTPVAVEAQTRNARARVDRTLDDRIRHSNHWAPVPLVRPQSLGPSLRDPIRGKGTPRVVTSTISVYGHTPEEWTRKTQNALGVVERVSGDTSVVIAPLPDLRRMGAWIPAPTFISMWPRQA